MQFIRSNNSTRYSAPLNLSRYIRRKSEKKFFFCDNALAMKTTVNYTSPLPCLLYLQQRSRINCR